MPDAIIASPVAMTPPANSPAQPSVVAAPGAATKGGAKLKTSAFKVPGAGSSAAISVVTVAALVALWFVVTNMGWVKPLFLPSPQAVAQQFYEYVTGQANDKPLWQHFLASMFRVFSAFLLACVTAIPIGIAMGMSRVARGIFDPPLEFYPGSASTSCPRCC
jgi:taurine transport system permease protein